MNLKILRQFNGLLVTLHVLLGDDVGSSTLQERLQHGKRIPIAASQETFASA